MQEIGRREALRRLSLMLGGVISASTASAILSGCGVDRGAIPYTFSTLTPDQGRLVNTIGDLIIPPTDTPGASAARVDEFVDLMISGWCDMEEKGRFMQGLMQFQTDFLETRGTSFLEADAQQQLAAISTLDLEAAEARRTGVLPLPFFGMLKEFVVVGYYTSEIGGSQELRHQIAFPKYDGNWPVAPGDHSWS